MADTKRVRLTVAYDGTNYHGWQVQNNGITIESELNRCLSDLLKEDTFNMRPYWKTPDGVKVLGSVVRHVSMGNGKVGTGGISKEDEEVGPTIVK